MTVETATLYSRYQIYCEMDATRKRARATETADSESSDDDVGPRLPPPTAPASTIDPADVAAAPAPAAPRRAPRVSESALLTLASALPSSSFYERSYMHRAPVTHVVTTPSTDFVVTADAAGAVKFWKKGPRGITFVKVYRAHVGGVAALVVSADGARVATAGDDGTVKFFDVASFDLTTMARLGFSPAAATWAYKPGAAKRILAVADAHSTAVVLLDGDDGAIAPLGRAVLHASPVLALAFAPASGLVISADAKGTIECWAPDADSGFAPQPGALSYASKLDTDLYALAKARALPTAITTHARSNSFCVSASDGHIRVFSIATGRIVREYAEGASDYASGVAPAPSGISPADLSARISHERTIEASTVAASRAILAPRGADWSVSRSPPSAAVFDDSGTVLLVPTLSGIKAISLDANRVLALIGARDATALRFSGLALFQGVATASDSQAPGAGGANTFSGDEVRADPTIFALVAGRQRFFLLTRTDPDGAADLEDEDDALLSLAARDTLNEPPSAAEAEAARAAAVRRPGAAVVTTPGNEVVITTNLGDIVVQLFPEDAPKACEVRVIVMRSSNREHGLQAHPRLPPPPLPCANLRKTTRRILLDTVRRATLTRATFSGASRASWSKRGTRLRRVRGAHPFGALSLRTRLCLIADSMRRVCSQWRMRDHELMAHSSSLPSVRARGSMGSTQFLGVS